MAGFHIPNLQERSNTKGIATLLLNLGRIGWGDIDKYHSVTTKLEKHKEWNSKYRKKQINSFYDLLAKPPNHNHRFQLGGRNWSQPGGAEHLQR